MHSNVTRVFGAFAPTSLCPVLVWMPQGAGIYPVIIQQGGIPYGHAALFFCPDIPSSPSVFKKLTNPVYDKGAKHPLS